MEWMLMPLRRYAEFSGRSRRKEYWMFFLGVILLYALLVALLFGTVGAAALTTAGGASGFGALLGGGLIGLLIGVVWLVLLIPTLSVGVRRLHDIDKSGWWLMIGYGPYLASIIIPLIGGGIALAGIFSLLSFVGFLVLLVMAVLNGTPGPNRFGDDPKGAANAQIFA